MGLTAPEFVADTQSILSARDELARRYKQIRSQTEYLVSPLSAEDQQVQSMPDASPSKWHLGHTSWFFDAVILAPRGKQVGDATFHYIFNSYYEALGDRQPRPQRGLLTRPSLDDVKIYRQKIDAAIIGLIKNAGEADWRELAGLLELGLQHEQQHQELILMDIKHLLSHMPSELGVYQPLRADVSGPSRGALSFGNPEWMKLPEGLSLIGAPAEEFSYDNERPRHRVWGEAASIRRDLVRCGEWLDFIADGGYLRPEFWLSDGWHHVNAEGWEAPLYWRRKDNGEWWIFTLEGERPIDPEEPVCHVSYYEADAFARWSGCRLPFEAEWERAVSTLPRHELRLHPQRPKSTDGLSQMAGAVWQWTASAYAPYPGFKPAPGAASEYNGKFMSGQMVLRGGACITPPGHTRPTYRNFYPPSARWAFSGVRLAKDA